MGSKIYKINFYKISQLHFQKYFLKNPPVLKLNETNIGTSLIYK